MASHLSSSKEIGNSEMNPQIDLCILTIRVEFWFRVLVRPLIFRSGPPGPFPNLDPRFRVWFLVGRKQLMNANPRRIESILILQMIKHNCIWFHTDQKNPEANSQWVRTSSTNVLKKPSIVCLKVLIANAPCSQKKKIILDWKKITEKSSNVQTDIWSLCRESELFIGVEESKPVDTLIGRMSSWPCLFGGWVFSRCLSKNLQKRFGYFQIFFQKSKLFDGLRLLGFLTP